MITTKGSRERADDIEALLTTLIKPVPIVTKIVGCSTEGRHDYEVQFEITIEQQVIVFHIEYIPVDKHLIAWATFGNQFPVPVVQHISEVFPNARCLPSEKGSYFWADISEEDFRQAVALVQQDT